MGYTPFPARFEHLCQYATYLAPTPKPPYSTRISLASCNKHLIFSTPSWTIGPCSRWQRESNVFTVNLLLKSYLSLPSFLLSIYFHVNWRMSFDTFLLGACFVSFWSASETLSFCYFPMVIWCSKHLLRWDSHFYPWGALATIRWSKTIQFMERVVHLSLPVVPDSSLYPALPVSRPPFPRLLFFSVV